MATLYGYDFDHPLAAGEFGKCGVAVSSLADMEILFTNLPLDKITTSMTINSPAAVIWAMYIVNAEKCGFPKARLEGVVHMIEDRKIRVLVAKPGLDGHDRGAKVIARALRDAGMEVIYTGIRQTPEMIAEATIQEDVDALLMSTLSDAHMAIFPRVMDLLKENDVDDVLVGLVGFCPTKISQRFKPWASRAAFAHFAERSNRAANAFATQ